MIFSADFKQCGIKHTIYKHLTGAHTGAPLRVYVEIHKKLTHSKTVDICSRFLLTHLKDVFEHYGLTPRFAKIKF